MASAAAQQYFDSFPKAEQDSIKASWGGADLMDEWYNNAKSAGATATPTSPGGTSGTGYGGALSADAANRALADAGGPGKVGLPANANQAQIDAWFREAVNGGGYTEDGYNTSSTAYERTGYNSKGEDASGFRKMAKDNNWSEDMDRWSESQLANWKKSYDPTCPPNDPFRSDADGSCVQKPLDQGGNTMPGGGANPKAGVGAGEGGPGGGGRGGPAGPPPPPPPPVTFGNQLTMTGNPLQDMLIGQFNTGQDPSTYQNNIFGLGEDMKVGGAGNNADASKVRQGQSLSGGGLWWGQDKETFSGFDASQKNAEGTATVSPAAKATPAPTPPAAPTPAPVQSNGPSRQGGGHVAGPNNRGVATPPYQGFQTPKPKPTPIATMTSNQYNNPVRNKPSYF